MSFCILPWIHIETTPQGEVRPCCLYKTPIPDSNLDNNNLKTIWEGEYMQDLRKQFLKGKKPKGCEKCWKAEEAGHRSKRQQDNERFSHHLEKKDQPLQTPVYLDLKLGTVCNIKCRTCSSWSSSKWAEDEKIIYGKPFYISSSNWVSDDSVFWLGLEQVLDKTEYIDFTGGEPFLIKRHVQILRKCVEKGIAKNICIHYNTNGTIIPTEEMFELWKNFKWVEIMFSIDGLNEHFNYIRHPADWNTVMEVFNEIKNKKYLHTSVCHTVSKFNVYYLPEFLSWFDTQGLADHQLFLNLLHNPLYLSIQTFGQKQKKRIAKKIGTHDRLKSILEFMNVDQQAKTEKFLDITTRTDQLRNENFLQTFPEFYKVLNQ